MSQDYRITVDNDETGDTEECEWFTTEQEARARFAEIVRAIESDQYSERSHVELCLVLDAQECGPRNGQDDDITEETRP